MSPEEVTGRALLWALGGTEVVAVTDNGRIVHVRTDNLWFRADRKNGYAVARAHGPMPDWVSGPTVIDVVWDWHTRHGVPDLHEIGLAMELFKGRRLLLELDA